MNSSTQCFRIPAIFQDFPKLVAAESTRLGGVSLPPYASLNLGLSTPDDPAAVAENRRIFFQALGIDPGQVASAHQVHGEAILQAEHPGREDGYDAFITNKRGLFLSVTVADCTPILIYDPVRESVAAIHAGWRGTVTRLVSKTLEALRGNYGTQAADCFAWIGTCIDACDYEVDADVANHFTDAFKRWDPGRQKFFLDLKAANKAQLLRAGVPDNQIEVSALSTVTHNDLFFSHRKEKGLTGRMLNVIGMG